MILVSRQGQRRDRTDGTVRQAVWQPARSGIPLFRPHRHPPTTGSGWRRSRVTSRPCAPAPSCGRPRGGARFCPRSCRPTIVGRAPRREDRPPTGSCAPAHRQLPRRPCGCWRSRGKVNDQRLVGERQMIVHRPELERPRVLPSASGKSLLLRLEIIVSGDLRRAVASIGRLHGCMNRQRSSNHRLSWTIKVTPI